jgi:D-alanine transaminase
VPPRELDEVVSQLIKMNDFECFLLYVQVSRVSAKREHAPKGLDTPSLLVFIDEAHPEEYRKPVSLITANDIRGEMCNVKCVNLLPNVLASTEASEAGADEAVFVRNGTVTEGSKSNCLILSQGVLKTHPTGRHILPGTIRAKALSLAPTLGIRVMEVPFTTADMMAADEVLISSSTKLIRRVAVIDGSSVGGRDTDAAKALQDALYRDFLSKTE